MTHTPGPWLIEARDGIGGQVSVFVTPQGKEVAAVYGRDGDVRVMGAAADLLAAAQIVMAGLQERIDRAGRLGSPVQVFDGIAALDAAIKKATGSPFSSCSSAHQPNGE